MIPRAAGFTLLEVLLVLIIFGVAAAIAVPRVAGALRAAEIDAAARGLAASMRHARGRAIAVHREQRVALDLERRRYFIPGRETPVALPEDVDIELVTARSQRQGVRSGTIAFHPDGSATGGQIRLSGAGRHHVVDIDWLTGAVRLYE
ncbi:MAG: GspH/FimT family pseudopilin [Gammaproteobacteria bacterium]